MSCSLIRNSLLAVMDSASANAEFMAEIGWLIKWIPSGSSYNCSTDTFDLGDLSSVAADTYIAASPQPPYVISRTFAPCPAIYKHFNVENATNARSTARSFWSGAWIYMLHRICQNLSLR